MNMTGEKTDKLNQIYNCYKDSEIVLKQESIEDFYEILETKSDINHRDDGYTILMRLSLTDRVDLVKLAVDVGADVNAVSNDNSFALYEAARSGRQEIYDYLAPLTSPELVEIAAGALPKGLIYRQRQNNRAVEAFVKAALFGDIDAVYTAISQSIDINAISSNGEAALHKAIRNNQLLIVQILLKAGANPNLKEEGGLEYPPLMIALRYPALDKAIFQTLLEFGANVNASSRSGETALMLAVSNLNLEAVRQLVELGADINAKNVDRYTALGYAIKYKNEDKRMEEIIRILKTAEAKEN